jgi:uncharacterized membrane protein
VRIFRVEATMAERPGEPPLASVLERNISTLLRRRRAEDRARSRRERVADAVTRFSGSMAFVALHLALVGAWVLVNVGALPWVPPFDPTFVVLATVASVEAIFLSTFVLITQNRMAAAADQRADLDLQISLLAEHEITRLVRLVGAVAARLGVEESRSPDLPELERDVRPEAVLDRIERAKDSDADDPGAPH